VNLEKGKRKKKKRLNCQQPNLKDVFLGGTRIQGKTLARKLKEGKHVGGRAHFMETLSDPSIIAWLGEEKPEGEKNIKWGKSTSRHGGGKKEKGRFWQGEENVIALIKRRKNGLKLEGR